MSENGEIYTAGKNFTLPPAVTAVTNSTSVLCMSIIAIIVVPKIYSVQWVQPVFQ